MDTQKLSCIFQNDLPAIDMLLMLVISGTIAIAPRASDSIRTRGIANGVRLAQVFADRKAEAARS